MKYATFGSVSHGTLRTEDLLDTFAGELDYQLGRQTRSFKRAAFRKLIREARAAAEADKHEIGPELVDMLCDALGEFSPPYGYFGTHPGDGADFGYWLADLEDFDGLRVADTSEVPRGYRGEVLHVNDHGNASLYVANGRGKLRSVWHVV